MDRVRRILEKVLPGRWLARIDLERRGIEAHVKKAAEFLPEGSLVLDSGAGQCRYKKYFDKHRYVGIDFARGESTWDYSRLDVIGRLERLPFADDTFDLVLSTQVMEHVPDPEIVLRETARVLRPGGHLYMTVPLGFGEHQIPHDYYRYTRYGISYLLSKTGFDVKEIHPRGGYFWYLAVMSMWIYLYLFPERRSLPVKIALLPFQILGAIFFIAVLPPLLSLLDGLDHEKVITLGFALIAEKPASNKKTPKKDDSQEGEKHT